MKRQTVFWLPVFIFLAISSSISAQSFIPERDSTSISLVEYATHLPKRPNLFNLNLQMNAGFNSLFLGNSFDEASFRFNQIKLEASGELNNRLFYWYRQQLNNWNAPTAPENLPESIEYAMIGYRINDKFTLMAGKQHSAWGGFEYDLNPIEVYQYSDMGDYSNCYFTGLTLAYQATETQELIMQVTNNRMGTLEDMYGILPETIQKGKAPLNYNINWNSSYFDEMLSLRYSLTAGQQAKDKWMYMAWAGQSLDFGSVNAYLDLMYARGGLDPLGVLSELTIQDDEDEYRCLQNVEYFSMVAHLNWYLSPKWKLFAKGMYETASIYKTFDFETEVANSLEKGKYRTAWGYQSGLEFFPLADDNLRFYFHGTGRVYQLTNKAQLFEASLPNSFQLSLGFSYNLPLF